MTLPPGPELDRLVAEAIGWHREQSPYTDRVWWSGPTARDFHVAVDEWQPSSPSGIAQAIEALEEFCRKHRLCWSAEKHRGPTAFYLVDIGSDASANEWNPVGKTAETLPAAICLAIVAAAEEEREK